MSDRKAMRERDAWDEDSDQDEGISGDDTAESSEIEHGSPAAATTQQLDMQQRMADVEASASVRLGDPVPTEQLGYFKRVQKNRKWRAEKKGKQMEQLAKMTPSFSQSTTFDVEETPNPTHEKVDVDHFRHRDKMLDLKTMGNHAAFVARIQDAPDIKHTFEEKHRKVVMCVAHTLPQL